jgi:hypothetical protein
MSLWTCVECSTAYAAGLDACPHCGSSGHLEGGSSLTLLPRLVTVTCSSCPAGPWNLRLDVVKTGLLALPQLFCASCGNQVQVPWPPAEEDMPKITVHGGPTNAREADVSPAAAASPPQDAAEGVLGHSTSEEAEAAPVVEELPEVVAEPDGEDAVEASEVKDYDAMSLAELREEATSRDIPSYGTKAQITERLREADTE